MEFSAPMDFPEADGTVMELDAVDPDYQRVNDDHQALARQVDVIQRLAEAPSPGPAEFVDALNRLAELSSAHFAHEEAYMASRGYDGLAVHKKDHEYLLRSLGELIASCEERAVAISIDIPTHLRSWLTFHIERYDMPFHEFAGHH